ncbi:MAG: DNA recombination protein RmuC [Dehalococcoidia bacterium]|nr:DNA recombination protein RmuC [Dehalococcoidia bacterium]
MMAVILLVGVIVLLLWLMRGRKSTSEPSPDAPILTAARDIEALKAKIDALASAHEGLRNTVFDLAKGLQALETKMVETTAGVKDVLKKDIQEAHQHLLTLKTQLEARIRWEQDFSESVRRIEAVLVGGRARGQAGENLLAEVFKQLPPDVVETNFRVNGRPVEFALILANGKRVPIDSKWTSAEYLERLERETDKASREKLLMQIEEIVVDRAREVSKYIDTSVTVNLAIAAVPDAVYAVCRRAHWEAYQQRVLLLPYSAAIFYILTLYHLHQQTAHSIDVEQIQNYCSEIERHLKQLQDELDNKVQRAVTMLNNATANLRNLISKLLGASAYLKSHKPVESALPQVGVKEPKND